MKTSWRWTQKLSVQELHRVKFLQLNQLDVLISQIYFWNKTLHASDSSSVHHQEFFTVHTAMVFVIQVCWQLAISKLSANLCVLRCVLWKPPDDGQRNCPKFVEFYSKNKFEKLVNLVGFIIRIYHDARSSEHQKRIWQCIRAIDKNVYMKLKQNKTDLCRTSKLSIIQGL